MIRTTVYPLVLEPILKEKVWGGRRLEHYGKVLAAGSQAGESWEVADMPATSLTGRGGDEARPVISNGLLAGRQLHDAVMQWGSDLLGNVRLTPKGDFPLLVKFVDAREPGGRPKSPPAREGARTAGEDGPLLHLGGSRSDHLGAANRVRVRGCDGPLR